MATFQPSGLTYASSRGTSTPMTTNYKYLPFNPLFNGFSGDIATLGVANATTTTSDLLVNTTSYGFCMPLWKNVVAVPGTFVVAPLVIGTFDHFVYFPLALNGDQVSSTVFPKDTALMPGTLVQAAVILDDQAIYSAQIKSDAGIPRWASLGCPLIYSGDATYTVVEPVTGATLTFPLGDLTEFGGSLAYFEVPTSPADALVDPSSEAGTQQTLVYSLGFVPESSTNFGEDPIQSNNLSVPNPTLNIALSVNPFNAWKIPV